VPELETESGDVGIGKAKREEEAGLMGGIDKVTSDWMNLGQGVGKIWMGKTEEAERHCTGMRV